MSHETSAFSLSVEEMMYGFGSEWPPDQRASKLVENLAVSYMKDLIYRAQDIASVTGKLDKECFIYLVRKDEEKFHRIQGLMKAMEELNSVNSIDEQSSVSNNDIDVDEKK